MSEAERNGRVETRFWVSKFDQSDSKSKSTGVSRDEVGVSFGWVGVSFGFEGVSSRSVRCSTGFLSPVSPFFFSVSPVSPVSPGWRAGVIRTHSSPRFSSSKAARGFSVSPFPRFRPCRLWSSVRMSSPKCGSCALRVRKRRVSSALTSCSSGVNCRK